MSCSMWLTEGKRHCCLPGRGEAQRKRMIDIAEAMMAVNDAAQSGGGERIASA